MDLNTQYGEDVFKDLSGRRIDALILLGSLVDQQSTAAQQILKRSLKRRLPIVEISGGIQQTHAVDCVTADYRAATRDAMAHLLELGHRRIGLVNGVAQPDMALDRLHPYQESLRAAGLPVEPGLVVDCGPTIRGRLPIGAPVVGVAYAADCDPGRQRPVGHRRTARQPAIADWSSPKTFQLSDSMTFKWPGTWCRG